MLIGVPKEIKNHDIDLGSREILTEENARITHPEHPYLIGSPDCYVKHFDVKMSCTFSTTRTTVQFQFHRTLIVLKYHVVRDSEALCHQE